MITTFRRPLKSLILYTFVIGLGIVMIYPLLWMVASSFRTNAEIMSSFGLIPAKIDYRAYIDGWKGIGQHSYGLFFANTFKLVLPTLFFRIVSTTFVGYGFSRFDFPSKKVLFSLMLATLMLPKTVMIIPRYMIFNDLGWLDSYLPFYMTALLATESFFIFLLVQFFRGIPRDLDESAYIDGCNSLQILFKILLPLCKPALFSVALFEFIWQWNDFFNVLIYISSVDKFPLSLGLRISMDVGAAVNWGQIMAMSVVTILPPVILFFLAQKYFVEGITTTGLKG